MKRLRSHRARGHPQGEINARVAKERLPHALGDAAEQISHLHSTVEQRHAKEVQEKALAEEAARQAEAESVRQQAEAARQLEEAAAAEAEAAEQAAAVAQAAVAAKVEAAAKAERDKQVREQAWLALRASDEEERKRMAITMHKAKLAKSGIRTAASTTKRSSAAHSSRRVRVVHCASHAPPLACQ